MADEHWLWESRTLAARGTRTALLPLAAVFRATTTIRNALFDAGVFGARSLGVPSVSVGNLTVGGTGKTPFASWLANELVTRGAHPAILLRGYGGDEAKLHALLAPNAIVEANADRIQGAQNAVARGADMLVLDDAMQHRRARRDADIALVSADSIGQSPWPLPAGPWREPLRALRRARLIVITRKAAADAAVERVLEAVTRAAPGIRTAVARLAADELVAWEGASRVALSSLRGKRALAASGIGDPSAFESQLSTAGVHLMVVRYSDHHAFSEANVKDLLRRADDVDYVVCTLKDAVKLGPLWPHGSAPLWYLSQRVAIERGAEPLSALIAELLAARSEKSSARLP